MEHILVGAHFFCALDIINIFYPHTFTGLFSKIPHKSPANGMTTGKWKESEVANLT